MSATYGQVWRQREFRAVLLADAASTLGDQITRVALTVLVFARTGSPLLSAAVFAVVYLPSLLGGPLLGALADRLPARRVLVGSDVARAVLVGLMALAPLPVAALLLLLLAVETVTVPFSAARAALLPELLEGEQYVVGAGLSQLVAQSCQVGGFALAGVLLTVVPARGALLVDAATFLLSAALLRTRLAARPGRAAEPGRSLVADTAEGLRVVRDDRQVRHLLLVAWTGCSLIVVPEGLAAAYVAAQGGSSTAVGLLLAAGPVGAALGSVVVTRLVPEAVRARLLVPLVALCALPLLGAATAPAVPVLAGLLLLAGLGGACLVVASTTVARLVEPGVRARVFGIGSSGLMVAQGVAVLGGGALALVVPVPLVLAVAGVAGLLAAGGLAAVQPRGTTVALPLDRAASTAQAA